MKLVFLNEKKIGLLDLIHMGIATPMHIKEGYYKRNSDYKKAAIMQSFQYSREFWDEDGGYYSEKAPDFWEAVYARDATRVDEIVAAFDGVMISEWDLSIPPRELVESPTGEKFIEIFHRYK